MPSQLSFPLRKPALSANRQSSKAPARASLDRQDMRDRLVLERNAWKRHFNTCKNLRTTLPAEAPTPEALDSMQGVASAQWTIVQSKINLFEIEQATDPWGRASRKCRRAAAQAVKSLREASMPPILPAQLGKLVGTWLLVKPTGARHFGDRNFNAVSHGLSTAHADAPDAVNVLAVVRTFTDDGWFHESAMFGESRGLRKGGSTVSGTYQAASATSLRLTPVSLTLELGKDTTQMDLPPQPSTEMGVCYIDDDVLLEGAYDAPAKNVQAWGRDHNALSGEG